MNNRDIQIYLLLSTRINEPTIVYSMIEYINGEEKKENLEYHCERYDKIARGYFKSIDRSPFTGLRNCYSYVLDNDSYIYEKDRVLTFFKETKIPFQCREILLDVIKNELLSIYSDKYIDNISGESKYMREENDKLYSPLSKLIMISMKNM